MLKYAIAEQIKQRPRLMATVWSLMPRLTPLLPHDPAYRGFRHVTQPGPDALFLDIGANNGISAAGFRKVVGRPYRIFSIEANPAHREALERLKRRDPEFDYRLVALGAEPDRLTIHTPCYRGTPLTAFSSTDPAYMRKATQRDYGARITDRLTVRTTTVDVVTLDSLGIIPSVIKVDVEGADYDALRGGEQTIRRHRPVVLFEYTPGYSEPMIEFLDSFGYKLSAYHAETDTFSEFRREVVDWRWSDDRLQVNVFALPDGAKTNRAKDDG